MMIDLSSIRIHDFRKVDHSEPSPDSLQFRDVLLCPTFPRYYFRNGHVVLSVWRYGWIVKGDFEVEMVQSFPEGSAPARGCVFASRAERHVQGAPRKTGFPLQLMQGYVQASGNFGSRSVVLQEEVNPANYYLR